MIRGVPVLLVAAAFSAFLLAPPATADSHPVVAILAPEEGAWIGPGELVVSGTAERATAVQVTLVEDGPWFFATGTDSWTFRITMEPAEGAPPGVSLPHTIYARALNGSEVSAVDSVNVSFRNTWVEVLAPSDDVPLVGPITCLGTAARGSAVRVRVDGAVVGTADVDFGGNWEFDVGTLSPGTHSLEFTAVEVGGTAEAPPVRRTITVASTDPPPPSPFVGLALGAWALLVVAGILFVAGIAIAVVVVHRIATKPAAPPLPPPGPTFAPVPPASAFAPIPNPPCPTCGTEVFGNFCRACGTWLR